MGLWEEADGGTILLDEITETSLLFQVKLLRALQQGEIRRVGSNRTLKVDLRVIAATNCDIEEEVRLGRFRQDLMYRLNAVMIHLPPLRDRVEDIPLLAAHFAGQIRPADASPVTFSPAALEILENYNWRGNVRELENAVCHAVSLCADIVYPHHLPARLLQENEVSPELLRNGETSSAQTGEWHSLAEIKAKYVVRVLAHTGGNKQAAARLLNIDRKTLTRVIKRSEVKT
jgi:DNA-binding NtrC family response regulator